MRRRSPVWTQYNEGGIWSVDWLHEVERGPGDGMSRDYKARTAAPRRGALLLLLTALLPPSESLVTPSQPSCL